MGLYKVNVLSEEKLKFLKEFFYTLYPRTIDYEVSVLAGKLNATVLKGQEIGWRDLFIAAITLLNGRTIITGNLEHFKRIFDLVSIEYY